MKKLLRFLLICTLTIGLSACETIWGSTSARELHWMV